MAASWSNWIAGNWPDGFKCLVSHDGVFDQRAMAYETEEFWFNEWEFGGPYYEPAAAAIYERWNPVNFVQNWRTPMLVIHSETRFPHPLQPGARAPSPRCSGATSPRACSSSPTRITGC